MSYILWPEYLLGLWVTPRVRVGSHWNRLGTLGLIHMGMYCGSYNEPKLTMHNKPWQTSVTDVCGCFSSMEKLAAVISFEGRENPLYCGSGRLWQAFGCPRVHWKGEISIAMMAIDYGRWRVIWNSINRGSLFLFKIERTLERAETLPKLHLKGYHLIFSSLG